MMKSICGYVKMEHTGRACLDMGRELYDEWTYTYDMNGESLNI